MLIMYTQSEEGARGSEEDQWWGGVAARDGLKGRGASSAICRLVML